MYELVDFGNGRKLERFGRRVVDRPCPAATRPRKLAEWKADARFEIEQDHRGTWEFHDDVDSDWKLITEFGTMNLFTTEFGHVGVFIEQKFNWQWMLANKTQMRELRILNLFAYTGGSTLAAAAAGASVTHIDSAKNMVRRARENADASRLAERPIRWITEDALKFVRREAKRGNTYDGVILDPPTYGHGTGGKATWKIDESLPQLFDALSEVVPVCRLLIFTCHSNGYSPTKMKQIAMAALDRPANTNVESGSMHLSTVDERQLNCGDYVRWCAPCREQGRAGE